MHLIENDHLALVPYTHEDDYDMYLCWKDPQTQKGYNFIFTQTFEQFQKTDLSRFKFWVTVIDKTLAKRIGVLRLGLDEKCPDLAIWIYPDCRNKGYGTEAFRLALEYIFQTFPYQKISAGCYCDNVYSLRMLSKVGFIRFPEEDEKEPNCFTGEETVQLSLKISKSAFVNRSI